MSVVKLGSNIASLSAQRRLSDSTRELSHTYERLASGLRINRASDDAAGLSLSQSLRADAKIFTQGLRNLNDGISLFNIAESAIEQLSNITVRLVELAEQAANGSYSSTQRKALDSEAQALSKEYFRISKTTKFNDRELFGGSLGQVNLQAGFGDNAVLSAGVGGAIGTGTLGPANTVSTSSGQNVNLADLNGDGVLDLIRSSTNVVKVQLGIGDGTFTAETSYATNVVGSAMALGDINGDGVVDIVTAFASTTAILLGRGDGSFGAATSSSDSPFAIQQIRLEDLDGDGSLDMISLQGTTIQIKRGLGDGTFGVSMTIATTPYSGESTSSFALGDMDNDGILDLVTVGNSLIYPDVYTQYPSLWIRRGLGDGTFGSPISILDTGNPYTYPDNGNYSQVLLGDLNGDGILDVVAGPGAAGELTVRLGTGGGHLGEYTSLSPGSGSFTRLGDLYGDGILDLVSGQGTSALAVRLGIGDGSFGAVNSFNVVTGGANNFALADINADGVLDVVTSGLSQSVLGTTTSGVAPLLPFSLKSLAYARQALPVFQQKLDQLTAQRGTIGAFQSRVTSAINTLTSARENYLTAESRITDADMAEETSALVRTQVLQKAASAVLAQANQQPQIVIRLLQD